MTETKDEIKAVDLEAVKRLRNYYRRNFADGASDAAFTLWLETALDELRRQELKAAFEKQEVKR